jgi:hypothetical protein
VTRTWIVAAVAGAATLAVEVAFRHHAHPVYAWHAVPAFDLVYGFLGCAAIVLASKALGRAFLQYRPTFARSHQRHGPRREH